VAVQRAITGFHADDDGDWVAELSCGHNQHVRHRPPFQDRPWVVDENQRRGRIGTFLDCPLCDRAELPDGLRMVRSAPVWDEQTMPAGLRQSHRLAAGTWARVVVVEGRLGFTMAGDPPLTTELRPGLVQAIPPEIEHAVSADGPVRFRVEFLASDRSVPRPAGSARPGPNRSPVEPSPVEPSPVEPSPSAESPSARSAPAPDRPEAADAGGDPACWAGIVCPECGAVLDGGPHRPGCRAG
jgi:tellurite resistance-related uncharacterized protein